MAFFYKFTSKKSIIKTLLIDYGLFFLFCYLAVSYTNDYKQYGEFTVRFRSLLVTFSGDNATTTISATKFISIFFFIISVYYTISAIISFHNNEFTSTISANEYVICANCRNVKIRSCIEEILCLTCGQSLEKLDGFYERHPEYKIEADNKVDSKQNVIKSLEENDQVFNNMFLFLAFVLGLSCLLAFFLNNYHE